MLVEETKMCVEPAVITVSLGIIITPSTVLCSYRINKANRFRIHRAFAVSN